MERNEELFTGLVIQYQQACMMALGKLKRPDGEISRNLQEASLYIDLLQMLSELTRGNLEEGVARLLEQVLADLRLNYVEEARHGEKEAPAEAPAEAAAENSKATESEDAPEGREAEEGER